MVAQLSGIWIRSSPLTTKARAANRSRMAPPVATTATQKTPSAKNSMGIRSSRADFATTPTEKCRSYNHIVGAGQERLLRVRLGADQRVFERQNRGRL